MALDIVANIKVENTIVVESIASTIRVDACMIDFNNKKALVFVSLGNTVQDQFVVKKNQIVEISGNFFLEKTAKHVSGILSNAFVAVITETTMQIFTDAELREKLIGIGEVTIR